MMDLVLHCTWCGRPNDAHMRAPGEQPVPGNVSLCWRCLEPSIFVEIDGKLGVRAPTSEERAEIVASDDFRKARAAIMESHTPSEALALRRLSANAE